MQKLASIQKRLLFSFLLSTLLVLKLTNIMNLIKKTGLYNKIYPKY